MHQELWRELLLDEISLFLSPAIDGLTLSWATIPLFMEATHGPSETAGSATLLSACGRDMSSVTCTTKGFSTYQIRFRFIGPSRVLDLHLDDCSVSVIGIRVIRHI